MAEHDYVIANQNGANTRSDLNNALAAIVSNNSKATAPTTTYAFMWWADTANDILKQRNGADSAWISILTLSTGAPLATIANFTSTGIDDNATSTAITIDASENVTLSGSLKVGSMNWSASRRKQNSAQALTNGTWNIISMNVTDYDSLGELDSTGRFTADFAGRYSIHSRVLVASNAWSITNRVDFRVYKNGVGEAHGERHVAQVAYTDYIPASVTTTINLAVGDYIDVRLWHNGGAGVTLLADLEHNHLSVHRIA